MVFAFSRKRRAKGSRLLGQRLAGCAGGSLRKDCGSWAEGGIRMLHMEMHAGGSQRKPAEGWRKQSLEHRVLNGMPAEAGGSWRKPLRGRCEKYVGGRLAEAGGSKNAEHRYCGQQAV